MKRLLALLPLLAAVLLASPVVRAQPSTPHFVAEGENVAHRLVAFALGAEVAEDDSRVVKAREWLARTAKATGEDERAIAASCVRAARYFLDLTRVRASPLETLEGVASIAKPRLAMSDALMNYVEARRKTAGKSHAEAMAALGAK